MVIQMSLFKLKKGKNEGLHATSSGQTSSSTNKLHNREIPPVPLTIIQSVGFKMGVQFPICYATSP